MGTSLKSCHTRVVRVSEEWKQTQECLLVRTVGQCDVGGHQVVDNAPQIGLQQSPSVLHKSLIHVANTLLGRKLKRVDYRILLPEGAVQLIELTVSFEHIPFSISDSYVDLELKLTGNKYGEL